VTATDEQRLIASLRSGVTTAFEAVFRTYAAPLCDLANGYLRESDVAEEVVQDFFAWLWIHRHELSPQHGLRAYLFGAVRNRALNVLRGEASARRADARLVKPAARSADAELSVSELERQTLSTGEGRHWFPEAGRGRPDARARHYPLQLAERRFPRLRRVTWRASRHRDQRRRPECILNS
jgi:DNA-directed RNA polymerase specialized sigma24 family protein